VASRLTPAQKAVTEAWNLDRGTMTPAGVWNLKAADLAEQAGLAGPETVRAFAALNVAMADAMIACWHAKYKWWTIRPISVIRERDDPRFLSYLLTPAFPSYPSGHASISGAAEVVLARFFPAKADWLRAQAAEAAESRLLGGIHYRSDNDEGLELGRAVGRRVVQRFFEPASDGPDTPVVP
jgi:membrane-associated phospholipid phosphatase